MCVCVCVCTGEEMLTRTLGIYEMLDLIVMY